MTAVNDAPVARERERHHGGGHAGVRDAFAATDVDSVTLSYRIVVGPLRDRGAEWVRVHVHANVELLRGDSFTFVANDGSVDSDVATVSLDVTAVNDAPVAADASASTVEDTPVSGDVERNGRR